MKLTANASGYFFTLTITLLFIAAPTTPVDASMRPMEPGSANTKQSPDKLQAPHFVMDEKANFPLKSTDIDARISGTIADVTITQTYTNESDSAIEAKYVFPASDKAAMYDMEMTVGDTTIRADIMKKKEARETYEKAKKKGKTASLVEQKRPNVFSTNVANIMPGDEITVRVKYTELLKPEDGVYKFVAPSVVMPRFNKTPDKKDSRDSFVNMPYQKEGEGAMYDFDFEVDIEPGMPVSDIQSPSHAIETTYQNDQHKAHIQLSDNNDRPATRDIELQYRLQGRTIKSGVLLGEGQGGEKYFAVMAQPPSRVTDYDVPPREYNFVVDVSGSMSGFPLSVAKDMMEELLLKLNKTDSFNITTFAGGSQTFSDQPVQATKANIQRAANWLHDHQGGGGTHLEPAMKKVLNYDHDTKGEQPASRSIVVVTDGAITQSGSLYDTIRDNLGRANMFAFGIGASPNRSLINGLAHIGHGEPFVVSDKNEASAISDDFINYVRYPVLTNIDVQYDGFDAHDVQPGQVPDLLAKRPIVLVGQYDGEPTGTITLTGQTGDGAYKKTFDLDAMKPSTDHGALEYLWARKKIKLLGDYYRAGRRSAKKTITKLGLKHNLMTDWTSFVAVYDKVRNDGGGPETVKQPQPLPDGVQNRAVSEGSTARTAPARSTAGDAVQRGVAQKMGESFTTETADNVKAKPGPVKRFLMEWGTTLAVGLILIALLVFVAPRYFTIEK